MAAEHDLDYRRLALEIAQGELTEGGMLRLRVDGDSMAPSIQPGDTLVLEPAEPDDLRVGDLVTVRRGSDVVTHRLIRRSERGLELKGDNRQTVDDPPSEAEVLGRVVAVEREAKKIQLTGPRAAAVSRMLAKISFVEARLWELARNRQSADPDAAASRAGRFARGVFRWTHELLTRFVH